MGRQAWRARIWALRLSLAGSLVLGVALVYIFAPFLGSLSSLQMLAMLGLVLLPAATAWAVLADRRDERMRRASGTPAPTRHPAPAGQTGVGDAGAGLAPAGSPAYRSP